MKEIDEMDEQEINKAINELDALLVFDHNSEELSYIQEYLYDLDYAKTHNFPKLT